MGCKKLSKLASSGGTADAEYSSDVSVVFPSDMEGVQGYIKLVADYPDEVFQVAYDGDVVRRVTRTTYWQWKDYKLIEDKSKAVITSVAYYDPVHRITDKAGITRLDKVKHE